MLTIRRGLILIPVLFLFTFSIFSQIIFSQNDESQLWESSIISNDSLALEEVEGIFEIFNSVDSGNTPDIFNGLINSLTNHSLSQSDSVPQEIFDLISNYNKSKIEDNPESVLSFITGAYSEHSFNETGSWIDENNQYRYVPFEGELPVYSNDDFYMPVWGNLTSGYGYRPQYKRFHHGIDISLNSGDTIRCALPGVVTKTGFDKGGYGIYVIVAHNGAIETLYGHLSGCIAIPGEKIKSGDPIAIGGSTGNSTGPHLHFETRYRGVPMDPLSWFNLQIKFKP